MGAPRVMWEVDPSKGRGGASVGSSDACKTFLEPRIKEKKKRKPIQQSTSLS
jgi:hypothetical protein